MSAAHAADEAKDDTPVEAKGTVNNIRWHWRYWAPNVARHSKV
jgi:hypothetical protein